MWKRAELMGASYAVLDQFADKMAFPKKLQEKDGIAGSYERISLRAFKDLVQFTFPWEAALEIVVNRTHGDPIYNSTISNRKRRDLRDKR